MHGVLYVALSRATCFNEIRILITASSGQGNLLEGDFTTKNVVECKEVLLLKCCFLMFKYSTYWFYIIECFTKCVKKIITITHLKTY